jgi:glycosyltransferase involved in cell wall biosynthesis
LAKAPVSACLIVKDEPKLARAVESVRPHVEEIVIVDTGSKPEFAAQAKKMADRFEVFTACNDEQGRIVDFSAARQRSFELATKSWILWLDADDEARGFEHLANIVEQASEIAKTGRDVRVLAPYEYAHDEKDRCVTLQWRERIMSGPASRWVWLRPVHEAVVAVDRSKMQDVRCEHLIWKHRKGNVDREPGRNLRILRHHFAKNGGETGDPRVHYDFAVELRLAGMYSEALHHVEKYLQSSGWPEERKLASLLASDMELRRALGSLGPDVGIDLEKAKGHAAQALKDCPDFDSEFAMAKLCYLDSTLARSPELSAAQLKEAIKSGERALDKVQQYGPLPTNPVARGVEVHALLHDAYARVGDWESALEHATRCVAANPEDAQLKLTQRDYERKCGSHRAERGDGSLDVVFACSHTPEKWSPPFADKRGIGGSETAVIAVAKGLAKKGHRVRVFCDCDEPGLHQDVEYRAIEELMGAEGSPDVLVAWRDAMLLEGGFYPHLKPRAKMVWAHDLEVANLTHARSLTANRVVAVSEWHKKRLCKAHNLHPDQVAASRNGIDLWRFDRGYQGKRVKRNPHKVVYSSSPERGIPSLLDMWPEVRKRVPDAELHVFYGVDGWKSIAKKFGSQLALGHIANLMGRLRMMEPLGVRTRGRIDQRQLALEFMSAGVWAMPTWFEETSCLTSMESQAAGLRIVTSPVGALEETTGDRATYVVGDWLSEEYQAEFVERLVEALGAPEEDEERERSRKFARANFSWEGVVEQWDALLKQVAAEAEDFVLPPYQGVV